MQQNEIIERLKTISILSKIKDNELALGRIASIIKIKKFSANTYIIREGEDGYEMFILNKGEVRIEKSTLSNDTFTILNLNETMNVFFGEVALMDNDVRSASVVALGETECFVINKKDFDELCADYPDIGFYIVKEIAVSLSTRLRKTSLDNVNLIGALISDDLN